ncbi:hypothetical protein A3G67_03715 [Candidatus Roizmanbacteria bacterium RIFCSPLOWO2_12_FULL_40_12]|uniref:DUF5660 domain-containing protein n=1 Tax=Candidatus Roizmanbacteria bacterium RIFCSPLOWO2_01_FULL_40_42 TaxID=1802066 RepID=A0A1F7J5N9_9BACT|nr:MAG: hypothetical protein A2779_03350 [Candidatus Roizmanbacteria bacterium RIFCSPHIGHO2_01_FULL_40_98]OGK28374.1 MAG: hypothetical protein A3C31_00715 [Candidatus Roizmanbacteria bacterium RIFCSPHIGHO2_02_FULL_40_53]OGK30610.1 MAG: hypothetical protein A2W49_03400 [Candidatus Roizmanbacteria bacterium RIFCSPHIGHO2_12_41_18]OGK37024.1 MAG: hypothetical protein A3E69_00975 [Candidatus Roizmanbacteria bacterium RIFCSPHIGHO2_12_FULL_40_130]OGK50930.1 MAG: hypothetical protein A3B50_01485 [Candi
MSQKNTSQKSKQTIQKNPYETLKNTSSGGIFDRMMGSYKDDEMDAREQYLEEREKKSPRGSQKEGFSLFRYNEYHEGKIVKEEIAQLTSQLKKEVEDLKKAGAGLMHEADDIDKTLLNPLPEKAGIYHVRFLEVLIKLVRTIRLKIGESKTWLEAMVSRKKKRGSAFVVRSKSKGTQYSLSQELQSARSVQ